MGNLSPAARWLGLIASAAMFALSVTMFLKTGDWVAAVFALGSLAYAVFFAGKTFKFGP